MKKFYSLFTILLGLSFTLAQTPIITAVADGDCTGGTPKMVEIYADGTVDFSLYSMEKQSNGGDWGTTTNLAEFGTVTDSFVYVYSEGSNAGVFATEFPAAGIALDNSVVNINGDDGIRIVLDSDMSVVDQFGENGVDGTGTFWEYKDGYAKRNNGQGPNATFTESEWTFSNGGLDGQGLCQGGASFQDVMGGIGVYTTGESTEPTLSITAPSFGQTFAVGTTEVTVEYTITNFTVGTDGHLHYQLNEQDPVMVMNSDPITLTDLTPGEYTLTMWLVNPDHNPLDPEVSSTVTFSIPSSADVATIAELRAGAQDGTVYTLTGEAILTMQQSFRGQKYIQDTTGAILIDDNDGVITTTYNQYDGITGITGTLAEFRGVMQFIPTADPGAASSTGNEVTPVTVTIADLNANPDMYESQLILVETLTTAATGDWANGQNYDFTEEGGTEALVVRTNFYNVDYIGTALPTEAVHLRGIAAEFNGTAQLFPRDSEDIMEALSVRNPHFDAKNVKVVVAQGELVINGFDAKKVAVYNTNGQLVSTSTRIANLPKGAYIVVMQDTEGKTTTVKFIKK